ncbi:MAG TPA: ATP-binding protein [Opitutaceae bacterium]|jgi:PAS domain S-box-containing protein|nr:ATP-binding protein [Opitutaceae bacterium]
MTATADLSFSELRYRRLFEAAHDGILIVDPETRKIIDVNPFLEKFLGYTYEEFIGKELFEIGLLADEAANQAAFRELKKTGFIRYEDLPLETKGGQCVDVEFVSNLYQEGDQQVIQCNVRDISVRKKSEKELHDMKEQLARHSVELEATVVLRTTELRLSNMQLETFVYSIAHDLRAPLRTMQGFAQLLAQEHAVNLNEQGREYANFINAAAQTMDHLLADLLAFSHISQQKIELMPVALEDVIQDALSACQLDIKKSQARIKNIPPWPTVMAHATTLRQVLVNLLSNALKFVATEAPLIRLWSEDRPGGIVRIWVEDNGIGIPTEFQEKIFQVFQRLHTTSYAGTGIGLAIVQKGMERMSGQVGVLSAPGEGSKFWIELTKAPAPSIESPSKELKHHDN